METTTGISPGLACPAFGLRMRLSDGRTLEYHALKGYRRYLIGNDGSVWSCISRGGRARRLITTTWHRMSPDRLHRGHRRVALVDDDGKTRRFRVSHLVLEAFVGPCPDGCEACHGPAGSSDDSVANLRWDTKAANAADRKRDGTELLGEDHPRSKVTDVVVNLMRELRNDGITLREIADRFGVTIAQVSNIVNFKQWKHIPEKTDG